MTELEKYREALQAITCIGGGAAAAEKAWKIAKDALNPPPEYEEVEEIVGWVNVYQKKGGKVYSGFVFTDKEAAELSATMVLDDRIFCQPIKVPVRREKRVPKERSAVIHIGKGANISYPNGDRQTNNVEGKAGVFTWQE